MGGALGGAGGGVGVVGRRAPAARAAPSGPTRRIRLGLGLPVLPPLLFLAVCGSSLAGQRPLTLEQIYSPDEAVRREFAAPLSQVVWLDERSYAERLEKPQEGSRWRRVEVRSGNSEQLYDPAAFSAALEQVGVDPAAAHARAEDGDFELVDGGRAALFSLANDLFLLRFASAASAPASVRALTRSPQLERGAQLSPDGRSVSFVRDHDLWVVDERGERQLTTGGSETLLHGWLDWVYQEEVYGRGEFRASWWSPHSRHLAFLELDQTPVGTFTVVDHLPVPGKPEVERYPKAGSPNPRVRLGVVPALGGEVVWVDTGRFFPHEHLIVRVGWRPDGSRVVFQVQDRTQRWLELLEADPETGAVRTLLREQSEAFVNVIDQPLFLSDGSFLWRSERSGFEHLYLYGRDGGEPRALTGGEWEVQEVYGIDDERGLVLFASNEHEAIGRQLYRAALAGGERVRLSSEPGVHAAVFSPGFEHYFDTRSDRGSPLVRSLHERGGRFLRVVSGGAGAAFGEVAWGRIEPFRITARDGLALEAMWILPHDFDAARRYPVLIYNYGGPSAPVVRNQWPGSRGVWHHFLAQQGVLVFSCDNRSAAGHGVRGTFEAYRRMGVIELRDLEDCVAWLRQQPFVAADRIGLWGWSYGGFLTAYALTHSTSFKLGIAGAPVTDWRLYDSIYTERYMGLPQENPEGYDETSVLAAAGKLHGKLLLLHGTIDDNVHFQNTVKLIYELQKAGRDFELMIYPHSRHAVTERELVYHLQRTMTRFVLDNL